MPQQEPVKQPIITSCPQKIPLNTPHKTITKIQFTTTKSWTIVVGNTQTDVSWISVDQTSGQAGQIELAVHIIEPNPSSLHTREAYLRVISDTALRVILITQPPRTNTDIAVSSVTLNKSDLKMVIGSTDTLVATVLPSNATQQSVVWNSKNPSVATVDQNGVISALKNGSAIVTATTVDADQVASCRITVLTAPENGGQINDWN